MWGSMCTPNDSDFPGNEAFGLKLMKPFPWKTHGKALLISFMCWPLEAWAIMIAAGILTSVGIALPAFGYGSAFLVVIALDFIKITMNLSTNMINSLLPEFKELNS
jgi:hypothetical protein